MEFQPGDVVEIFDINGESGERERDEWSGECFRWIAVQCLNKYGGVPMRVMAINEPFVILRSLSRGPKVLVDTRMIALRLATAAWIKQFVT